MKELLFLAHRIPYPPDKGDKIRSYHVLAHLAQHYRVSLGAFVDATRDWTHQKALQEMCAEVCLVPVSPLGARLRSARALWRREPLSMCYYRDARMTRWITELMQRRPIERVFVFCAPVAQYAPQGTQLRRVLDFCDVDSDKWRQYARTRPWPLSQVYAREARYLEAAERQLTRQFDASLLVSEQEAELLRQVAPGAGERIHAVRNGVDADYFDPLRGHANPFPGRPPTMVFTGAMDYWANVDAVTWFARMVLPLVRAQVPRAQFAIVGSNPAPQVRALAREPGVMVTGAVPDVRPYLANAHAAVAPLRIARGVQNKVLEAMAMARPVVATRAAVDGIDSLDQRCVRIADAPGEFAAAVLQVLDAEQGASMGRLAREFVRARYDWQRSLEALTGILEGKSPSAHLQPEKALG